ncbi:transposable element Tc1 transposase [Trichonephila clavipes]|nr:transposable element Tc1 transposase [Trichonephila clavipes]
MFDHSNEKSGMITETRLTGASVTRTTNLVGGSRTATSRVMTPYTNLDKMSAANYNSGRKSRNHDRHLLKRMVTRKRKTTLSLISSRMNIHLQNHASMKTVQQEMHIANIHGKVPIRKPFVSAWKAVKRLQ